MVPPSLNWEERTFTESYSAELSNLRPKGKIHYTTDGSGPDINSAVYSVPLILDKTTTLKAFTKWDDGRAEQ